VPLVLDATPGSETGNSYVTLQDAATYFEGRLAAAAWDAADQPTRERALVAATARLEQESYAGARATMTQRLKWPRVGAIDDDGVEYDATSVPRPVQAACCELALHLLTAGASDALAPSGLESFDALAVGALDLTIRRDAPAAGALPPQVRRLLRGLLVTPVRASRVLRAS
jgi:hypothetical protein